MMKVGNKIANQFIFDGQHYGQDGKFFQSFDCVIAFRPANGDSISLDRKAWNHSNATDNEYRNQFFR